jgi:hypothetical protein
MIDPPKTQLETDLAAEIMRLREAEARRLLSETPITLSQAAKLLPSSRDGKKTHVSTVFRFRRPGLRRRACLEMVKQPGGWVTSVEAVARFVAALTAEADAPRTTPDPASDRAAHAREAARRKRLERVDRELAALGV